MQHTGKRRRTLKQQDIVSTCEASLQSSESGLHCSGEGGDDFGIHVGFSVLDELVGSLPCDGCLLHEVPTRSTPDPEGVASSRLGVLPHQVDDGVRRSDCSISEEEHIDWEVGVLLLLVDLNQRRINLGASHVRTEALKLLQS